MSLDALTPLPPDPRLSSLEGLAAISAQVADMTGHVVTGLQTLVQEADMAVAAARAERDRLTEEITNLRSDALTARTALEALQQQLMTAKRDAENYEKRLAEAQTLLADIHAKTASR